MQKARKKHAIVLTKNAVYNEYNDILTRKESATLLNAI